MHTGTKWARIFAAAALLCGCNLAVAQSSVSHGRITAVNLKTQGDSNAQVAGAILGGGIGLASGSRRSGSNRALRTIGGGFAGQQIARAASNRQAFEYTILIDGTSTVRMISDEAGLRVGDCVAVERGAFNNLRLVDDARCEPPRRSQAPAAAAPQAPVASREEQRLSDACIAAKEQLLTADDEASFDRAERRVRLLCVD